MAVSFIGSTALALRSGTSIVPTIHGSAATGDLLLAMAGGKPYTIGWSMPGDWTLLGVIDSGSTAISAGNGSTTVAMWWKQHDGSESNPTITGSSMDIGFGTIHVYRKGASEVWAPAWCGGGGDEDFNTSCSINATIDPGISGGDFVSVFHAHANDNTSFTAVPPSITAAGLTMGSASNAPGQAGTTSGNNILCAAFIRAVSSGTASGLLNSSGTISVANRCGAAFTRVRAAPAPLGRSQAIVVI